MLRVWVLGFGIFAWERGGREGERARERERDREREDLWIYSFAELPSLRFLNTSKT